MYTGQTILHHPGGCQGFGSHVFLLPEHDFGLVVIENGGGGDSKIAQFVGREIIGRRLGIPRDERRGEEATGATAAVTAIATEQDPGESGTPTEEEKLKPSMGVFPTDFDATIIPGTYEHKAYGKIQISLAPSASLRTQNPTIDGVRLIRNLSKPPQDQVTDTNTNTNVDIPTYHISFLGRRSFLASILIHQSPQSHTLSPSHNPNTNTNTKFFTLENLWPHGTLQSDPIPNLPEGHGFPDDPKHPFTQEPVYESQSLMGFGACVERCGDGVRVGLVLGRTESSEFRARDGDREGLVEGWRGKMVWFGKIGGV